MTLRTQGAARAAAAAVVCLATGCLQRPVESRAPNLKTTVNYVVSNQAVDKIDLLFDIDNSASMGDKQAYLQYAITDLINRLVNPNCIDGATNVTVAQSANGVCPAGSQVEFPPVHDMHIGVLSSALGSRLGDVCVPNTPALAPFSNLSAHDDDQAHLLGRSLTYSSNRSSASEGSVADAAQGFLYWYPATTANDAAPTGAPVTSATTLVDDFSEMIGGVGVFGCGVESQLETWYRFLIQPDPYATLTLTNGLAAWSDVDTTILQQRHDFLRPDSLVAIVVLTDENDSEIDVRSLGQQGFNWMNSSKNLPRGTAACGLDGLNGSPASPDCKSCAELTSAEQANDTACAMGPYSDASDWGMNVNLRHVHTKAKYGVDPQFPIGRYVNGLSSPTVPDRDGEYPVSDAGQTASSYVGTADCTNPLFAQSLPDGSSKLDSASLCKLAPGSRTKDLVFFAHIGGVPWQLLHFDPTSAKNSALTNGDWVKILGKDPSNYDFDGIDPHMVESFQPRPGVPAPGSPPSADDAIVGHDWITNTNDAHVLAVDREYACTFPLADEKGNPAPRDCTLPQNSPLCDCPATPALTAEQLPPICDPTTQTTQTGAKAYPTIRELELVQAMGAQGIVSSICPQHVTEETMGDPLFGYRPAVAAIVDRLKVALTGQCLPEELPVTDGVVPCLVLVTLPPASEGGPGGTCKNPICNQSGLVGPGGTIGPGQTFDPSVLDQYCDEQERVYQENAEDAVPSTLRDPALQSVCAMVQLTPQSYAADAGTCAGGKDAGWCYVTGSAAGSCSQQIVFASQLPSNVTVSLQCVEQSVGVVGDY